MIVCHSRKFIFVAVPKTGSQAIRDALQASLAPGDWEQCGLFARKAFPVPELAAIRHGHISCRQVRTFLSEDMWRSYRKFAFVRDPVSRLRSAVRFLRRNVDEAAIALDTYKRVLSDPRSVRRVLIRPQSEFLCDDDGALLVDDLGRYETLDADFRAIAAAIAIPLPALQLLNVSPRKSAEPAFDAELTQMILEFYREDFERFDFPRWETDVGHHTKHAISANSAASG